MDLIKKYGPYGLVLITGLFLGYLFSGKSGTPDTHRHDMVSEEQQQYTCSMHPQVRQGEKGSCPLCGMDLTLSEVSGSEMGTARFKMTENALALANIETTKVGLGNFDGNNLVLSGRITSNEQTNAIQTTIFEGRIEKLNVNYVGEYIKKGEQLGVIYAPGMYAAQDKLLTSASYKNTHEKLYQAARNTLGLWKMSDAQVDELLKTGKPLMNFPLTATVSGTVTEVIAAEGNWYREGDPLFKVSNLYTVWAVFDAYEDQLPALRVGQPITIGSKAFNGKTYEAKIAFVEPVLDAARRIVSVRATLVNKQGLLKPGMFVEGSVATTIDHQVLTVPKSAVMWTGKRSLVYRKPDPAVPVFETVEVSLGEVLGDSYVILKGLAPGDEVVTNGTFTVDAAAQLQGKKSMMGTLAVEETSPNMEDAKMTMNFTAGFKNKFKQIVRAYVALKDALVLSDATKSSSAAKGMVRELQKLDHSMMDRTAQSHLKIIMEKTHLISTVSEIEGQRDAFKPLSKNMVAIVSAFRELDEPIYVQYCPMADNNQGGYWLSFQDKVQNPYFGDRMLTCGSVAKTIQ